MRVVDITQWYAPTSGGIRTYLHAKAAFAQTRALHHAIVVPGERPGSATVYGSQLAVVRGRTPTDRWGYRVVVRAAVLIEALERLRPSLVVLHDCLAFPRTIASWAAKRGVPLAMVCHSDLTLAAEGMPDVVRRLAGTALGAIQRRGLAVPSMVLLPSQTTGRRVGNEIRGKTAHVPLGVDLETFASARADVALHERLTPNGGALVLYAGRLSSEKGVLLLPRALSLLRVPAQLVIAGAGPLRARMEVEARRFGVGERITFLGHVGDRARLASLMATADCFVHPNPREAFGLAPLEAVAAGCRVVAPSTEGCRENLARRGCVLVRPDHPGALAQGIERALAGARPHVDLSDLGWDRTFSREWEIYRELAA